MAILQLRAEPSSAASITDPIYIAGFCVVGAIVIGLGIWIIVVLARKRARAKRESIANGAFLSIRGLVKEEESSNNSIIPLNQPGFSRKQVDNTVVMPDKVLQRPPRYTSDDVIDYHRRSGTLPKPFSFALSATSPASEHGGIGLHKPNASISSKYSRFSVYSTTSSIDSNPTTGSTRKVKQVFEPVLPDELLIRVGDSLTLVQSFDDGWCVVGRESTNFISNAKSMFRPNEVTNDGIELGVVPAWCFIRPAPGLRAERPIRSTSLGITVELNVDAVARDHVMSWSNF